MKPSPLKTLRWPPSGPSAIPSVDGASGLLGVRRLEKRFLPRVTAAATALYGGLLDGGAAQANCSAAIEASGVLTLRLLALLFAEARGLLPAGLTRAVQQFVTGPIDESGSKRRNDLDAALSELSAVSESPDLFSSSIIPGFAEWRFDDVSLHTAFAILADEFGGEPPPDFACLPVFLMARAYESLLDFSPGSDVAPASREERRTLRKASGKFVTPPTLVQYVVRNSLTPIVEEALDGAAPDDIPDRLLSIKVLDPAVGCGDFLVSAARFIGNAIADKTRSEPAQWVRLAAQRCVYGVDNDPVAVAVAKVALWIDAGVPGEAYWANGNVRYGNSLIGTTLRDIGLKPNPKRRQPDLYQGHVLARAERLARSGELSRESFSPLRRMADVWISRYLRNDVRSDAYQRAMLSNDDDWFETGEPAVRAAALAAERRFFHWDSEFPEVFFDSSGLKRTPGFDAVLGNPPYVAAKNEDLTESLRIHGSYGQSDYYLFFLSNIIRRGLVRRGGYLSMVLPDPFLARQNAAVVRRTLVGRWTMESLLHVKGMFPGAVVSNVVPVCRNVSSLPYEISVRRVDSAGAAARFAEGGYAGYDEFFSVAANTALAQRDAGILYLVNEQSRHNAIPVFHRGLRSMEFLREPFRRLGELDVEIYRGEEIGKRAITDTVGDLPILLGGQSVRAFHIIWEGRWMDRSRVKKPLERYLADKIVAQKSTARLVAAIDLPVQERPGFVVPQSVYCIRSGSEGPGLYYLLAILNSSVMNDYVFRMFTGYKLVQPQIEIEDLKRLPIRMVRFALRNEEREELVTSVWPAERGDPSGVLSTAAQWLMEGRDEIVHDLIVKMAGELVESQSGDERDRCRDLLDRLVSLLYGLPETSWRITS